MQLQGIIARRQEALLTAWFSNVFFQIQTHDPASLGRSVFIGDDGEEGAVSALGRRNDASVVCVERPGDPDVSASVWVSSVYGDYRGAYLAFVRRFYGGSATKADLVGYDVDHLLNRARSPKDTTFIRLEAIPSIINQRWGALYERAASSPHFYANRVRENRTLSWMVASKLAGQMPPDGPDDQSGINRLVQFWSSRGFSSEQVSHGITDDLNFIFGRPRGGIVQYTAGVR